MQTHSAPEDKTFLTARQVQGRYQRSHVSIWRWVHDKSLGFPAPIKMNGRHNFWRLADLEAWEATREAESA